MDTIHDLVQITVPSNLRMDLDETSARHCSDSYQELPDDSMDVDSAPLGNLDECGRRSASSEEVSDQYAGAAMGYGDGMTFMDIFDSDGFSKERESNLYYPFAGEKDWQVAHYLLASGLSMAAIDAFLSLDLVC